jgi:hypothetical protein
MLDSLFDLPIWLTGLSLIVVLGCVSLAGLIATRRWVLPRLRIQPDDSNFSSAITQSVMVFYGLVVALIAVSVWQRNGQVSDIVSGEATAIAALWRDFGGYPEPERETLRTTLRGYTEQILNEAWPMLHKGQIPRGGVEWMNRLQGTLYTIEPASEGKKILHAETLRAYNHLILMRRMRLDAADTALPGILWLVIILGAFVCMTSAYFFRVEDYRFQALMVVLLALFVSLVIFVVFALDRPFRGDLAVSSDSYRLVYDQLMKP